MYTLSQFLASLHAHTHTRALQKSVHWSIEKKPNISTKFNWKHACDMLIFSLFRIDIHKHTSRFLYGPLLLLLFFCRSSYSAKLANVQLLLKYLYKLAKKYTYFNTHIHVQITHLNLRTYNENQWSNEWQAKKTDFFKRQMYINKQFENWFFINWWNTESMELNWIEYGQAVDDFKCQRSDFSTCVFTGSCCLCIFWNSSSSILINCNRFVTVVFFSVCLSRVNTKIKWTKKVYIYLKFASIQWYVYCLLHYLFICLFILFQNSTERTRGGQI